MEYKLDTKPAWWVIYTNADGVVVIRAKHTNFDIACERALSKLVRFCFAANTDPETYSRQIYPTTVYKSIPVNA